MADAKLKQAWWLSWYSPQALGGFELHTPWWVSGWSFDKDENEISVIVAAVRANSEDEAFALIEASYDTPPDGGVEPRFIEPLDEDEFPWNREGSRFQLGDWMEWE